MTFWGMETEQARGLAEQMDTAARRLEDLMSSLDGTVTPTPWEGPDADSFRDAWRSTSTRSRSEALPPLGDLAGQLTGHAEEQDSTSDPDGGDGISDLFGGITTTGTEFLDWLGDRAEGVLDGVRDGFDWLDARATEARDGLWEYGSTLLGNLQEVGESALGMAGMAWDAVVHGEWPRFTEVLVGGLDLGLDVLNTGIHALTGVDLHLADDGSGYADEPVQVSEGQSGLVPPRDLASIIQNTNTTYGSNEEGAVSMSVVGGNPPTGVIVNIPGTESWSPLAGDNPMDLTGNAAQAGPNGWSVGSEATQDGIRQLFESQNIPPGTPIMLSGHSQGGMIAESLISNPEFMAQYNVTNVVTYGSPVDDYSADPSVRQLNIQHTNDAVPLINLEDAYAAPRPTFPFITPVANLGEIAANLNISSGNTTTATLPPPGDPFDIGGAHDGSNYQSSVQQQLQDPASQISQWSSDPSLAPFLTSNPSAVTQYTSQVHREN